MNDEEEGATFNTDKERNGDYENYGEEAYIEDDYNEDGYNGQNNYNGENEYDQDRDEQYDSSGAMDLSPGEAGANKVNNGGKNGNNGAARSYDSNGAMDLSDHSSGERSAHSSSPNTSTASDGNESGEEEAEPTKSLPPALAGLTGLTVVAPPRKRKTEEGSKKPRRKKAKKDDENGDDSEDDSDSSGDEGDGEGGQKKNGVKSRKRNKFGRKNIHTLIADDKVNAATKTAQQLEAERLERLQEQQRLIAEQQKQIMLEKYRQQYRQEAEKQAMQGGPPPELGPTLDAMSRVGSSNGSLPPLPGHMGGMGGAGPMMGGLAPPHMMRGPMLRGVMPGGRAEVVTLGSSSDEDKGAKDGLDPMVAVSSDSDECRVISGDEEEEEGEEDPNNSGMHVNDLVNCPDEEGRVLVNLGHVPEDEDVFLDYGLQSIVKPHQIGGVRFLYDNIIESPSRYNSSEGFGCILAHSMGLGKTLQIVTFCEVFLRVTTGYQGHVLVIVPVNVIQNWLSEFNQWLPEDGDNARQFYVHVVNDACKNLSQRASVIAGWRQDGGVLLMGYELYRQLANKKPRKKRQKKHEPVCIDIEEEDTNKTLLDDIQMALVNPGPDLVICDEGHRIKNSHASISQALKQIKTKRRVVLTGYPLQNNLMEYWCMVDFVRPNYLGNKTEFSNMFERPIQNGQCIDSTPKDKRLMKHRAHVLHEQLKGFVQRRGHAVLRETLPKKSEHVLFIRMTPVQRTLYKKFMDELISNRCVSNPLKAFAVCCKIWNHPDMLYNFLKKKEDDSMDIELESMSQRALNIGNRYGHGDEWGGGGEGGGGGGGRGGTYGKKEEINYDWAQGMMSEYVPEVVENSYKLELFLGILEETLIAGDRILLFSQSLLTLNLLEAFLQQRQVHGYEDYWTPGYNYFRLDGSTNACERERLINVFNNDEHVKLFMVSTRAGSLGINLVGANRVIVFDASWNPCHDTQAVCRVYRYGQVKTTHVYRFVADNSLEKKIYDRQVNKQGMADRVVDEMNPDAHLSSKDVHSLICDEEDDPPVKDYSEQEEEYTDPVLKYIVKNMSHTLTKQPFTHESQLVDKKDEKMSKSEKKLAERAYKMERTSRITYSRPSYAAFYPKPGSSSMPGLYPTPPPGSNGFPRNRFFENGRPLDPMWSLAQQFGPDSRPMASVRPLQPELDAALNGLPPPYPVPLPASVPPSHIYPGGGPPRLQPGPPHLYPAPGTSRSGAGIPDEFLVRPSSQPGSSSSPLPPSSSQQQRPKPPQLKLSELDQYSQPLSVSSSSSNSPTTSAPAGAIEAMSRQGVDMTPITIPHDIEIPTGANSAPIALKAGQSVMVIKTPKGMYLRLNDKIIKIKGGMLGLPSRSSNENSPSGTPPLERRDYPRETIDLVEENDESEDNNEKDNSNEAIDLVDDQEIQTVND